MHRFSFSYLAARVLRLAVFCSIIGTMVPLAMAQQNPPPNDLVSNAVVLAPLGGFRFNDSNRAATLEVNEPTNHFPNGGGSSVWFQWTPVIDGNATFNTFGQSPFGPLFDTMITVSTSSSVPIGTNGAAALRSLQKFDPSIPGFVYVENNDDASFFSGKQSQVTFPARAGTTYFISVDGTSFPPVTNSSGTILVPGITNTGFFDLSWGVNQNDSVTSATPIYGTTGTILGNNLGATAESGEPDHNGNPANSSVWYLWTAPDTGSATFTGRMANNGVNCWLDAYTGDPTDFNSFATVSTTARTSTSMTFDVVRGVVYLIVLDSPGVDVIQGNMCGNFTLGWRLSRPPNPAGAFQLSSANYTVSEKETTVRSGNEPPGLLLTFTRTNGSTGRMILGYQLVDGSARNLTGYTNATQTVVFEDFQMSASVVVLIADSNPNNGTITNFGFTSFGQLSQFSVQITNVVCDPSINPKTGRFEDPTLIPDFNGTPSTITINSQTVPNGIQFSRARYFRNERGGVAHLQIRRNIIPGPDDNPRVLYRINHLPNRPNENNTFPLSPSSDYAYPDIDYTAPPDPDPVQFGTGSLTANIDIPILASPDVNQNLDLFVELVPSSDPLSPSPSSYILGPQSTAILTIYSGDQPAGALDGNFNRDNDGGTSPPFNTGPGANNPVYALVVQPDQKTVIAGDFTSVNAQIRNRVARLNSNGQLDTTFNPSLGADQFANALALQPDGKVIIGGGFSSINGISRNGIARLNSDGSLDGSFNPGAGVNPGDVADKAVEAVAVQADGKILIAGNFNLVNGVVANRIARLNTDGSVDSSFSVVNGPDDRVYSIVVQSDGRILVSGAFHTMNGSDRNGIARLSSNGFVDPTFDPQAGADDSVFAIIVQNNGKIVLGGAFRSFNGLGHPTIVRLNSDGTVDSSFDSGSGADNTVYSLALQPDGAIMLGGLFRSFNSTRRIGVARVLANGSLDTSFMDTAYNQFAGLVNSFSTDPDNACYTMGLMANGNLMIGGTFAKVGAGGDLFDQFTYIPREDWRIRNNVARLIGGVTPGPGNFEFATDTYSVDEGGGFQFLILNRTNGAYGAASVIFQTSDGSARAGTKYTAVPGINLTWGTMHGTAAGPFAGRRISDAVQGPNNAEHGATAYNSNTFQSFGSDDLVISITDNAIVEGNQYFYGSLSLPPLETINLGGVLIPIGAALGRQAATVSIVDNDFQFGSLGFKSTTYTTNENSPRALISVVRSNGVTGTVTIKYAATAGTAVAGVDFTPVSGTLTFSPGQTLATFTIPLLDDTVPDGAKTVLLALTQPTGGAATNGQILAATLTIVDNDPPAGTPAGSVNTAFSSTSGNNGANNNVSSVVGINYLTNTLSAYNGRWMVGGDFTIVDGIPRNRIARLNIDGSVDTVTFTNLGAGPNNSVYALVVHTNAAQGVLEGRTVIAGAFTTVNGFNRSRIARLNLDGSLDTSFNPGSGADNPIYAAVITPAGQIIIAGDFASFNGTPRSRLARLNLDGTIDLTFNPGLGADNAIRTLALDSSNRVVIGGDFLTYNGASLARLARLNSDGSIDPTFNSLGAGANGRVRSLAVDSSNRIVVGGDFTTMGATVLNRIARLGTNGAVDGTFNVGAGTDNGVYSIVIQPTDGRILVGGDFTKYNNVNRTRIARLNPDGLLDPSINFGSGPNGFVASMALIPGANGNITLGGGFTEVDGFPRAYVAQIIGGNNSGPGKLQFTLASQSVNENQTNVVITVRRTGGLTNQVSVNYTNIPGTALRYPGSGLPDGFDYTNAFGTLIFHQAEAIQTFSIGIIDNTVTNINKTLTNILFNATNYIAGVLTNRDATLLGTPTNSTLTIINDDSVIGFTLDSYTVNENDVGGFATITVQRAGGAVGDVSFNYSTTTNGTATAGADYVSTSGTLTFTNGQTTAFFLVPIFNDNLIEGNESVPLILSNVVGNATIGKGSATLTILDDDFAPGQLMFSTDKYSIEETGRVAVITVIRTNGTTGLVTVNYSTANGTALAYPGSGSTVGFDYTNASGTLTFADGETNKTILVGIIDDTLVEGDETINVTLNSPTGGATLGSVSAATLTILDNDYNSGIFSFVSTNYVVSEGIGTLTVGVQRSSGTAGTVTMNFATADGTAIAGADYIAAGGSLSFAPGDTLKTFKISVIDDTLVETNEFFTISLSGISGGDAIIRQGNALVTILDNDVSPGVLGFSAPAFTVNEGDTNAIITVTRTNGTLGAVSVNYATSDGRAVAGADYLQTSGTLNFADGDTVKTFSIRILDDNLIEGNETLNLTLSSPTGGASVSLGSAILTIIDNDVAAGSVDTTFNIGNGFDNSVNSIVLTGGSKILAAGDFTLFNSTNRSHLARLNSDGSLDASFDPGLGANDSIRSIATLGDGRIVAGGLFNRFNGAVRNGVVILNTDGSLDPSFSGSGADNAVNAVAVQTTGQPLIAGAFTAVNGTNRNFVARMNLNGTLDTSFNSGAGPDAAVYSIAVQSDGRVLIGGDFTVYNGVPRGQIARLNVDGSLDTTFNPGLGPNGSVRTIALQRDGRILIGGLFTSVNGSARNYVARLNIDGSVDSSFNPVGGPDDYVVTVVAQDDGKIVIGGGFGNFNGVPQSRIARLNSNGSLDTTINFGSGANNFISTIAIQADGKLVIGGGFTLFNAVTQNYITRVNVGSNVGAGSLEFSSPSFTVNENGTNAVVTIVRTGGATGAVTVDYATSGGTATAGVDYSPVSGTLSFASGESVKTILVPITDDGVVEGDETIGLVLSNPTGGAILGLQGTSTLTILDDDGVISFSAASYTFGEGTGSATITAIRTGGSISTVTVDFATVDGTARAGADYTQINTTLTFSPGVNTQVVLIPIIEDTLVEGTETVFLTLTNVTGSASIGSATAVLNIIDNDHAPGLITFAQGSYIVSESGTNAVITVIRTNGFTGAASVSYTTGNGTAQSGSDYVATSGTLSFADGEVVKSFLVRILDDSIVEGDETVNLTLSNPTGGASLGSLSQATLIIQDDPSVFAFTSPAYTVLESATNALINVQRFGNSSTAVSVTFGTVDGSATAGLDYTGMTNVVLNFAAGETNKTIAIPIVNDLLGEGDETVFLVLSNPTGESILSSPNTAVLTIIDDDTSFSFDQPNYVVDEGAGILTVTVLRTGVSSNTVSVNYATSDGTANAGSDYVFTTGALTFAPGETNKTFNVQIIDDAVAEGAEYFNLSLVTPTGGATLGTRSNATVSIIDNEIGISFSSATYSVSEGGGQALITVRRTGIPTGTVSVHFATANGTATAGSDYASTNGTLTFLDFETVKAFTVPIINDSAVEGDETVLLTLSSPVGAALLNPANAVLTILDDDTTFSFSASSYSVSEATSNAPITIRRNGGISGTASVDIAVFNGTATAASDYIGLTNTIVFLDGESVKLVNVRILDDIKVEGNETVNLALSNPTNGVLGVPSTAVLTIIDDDGARIVPAGSALTFESVTPANGIIDPGETVTVSFGLRNTGNIDTTNLVATLLVTNGITSPSAPQTFGALTAGGPLISKPFTFTASGTNGGTIVANLQLQDGSTNFGVVTFTFVLGSSSVTFSNTGGILINDNTNATPYPTTISVSGLNGSVTKATVRLNNLSHTFPSDIDMILVGPNGQKTYLMSDTGGRNPVSNVNLVFDDSAASMLPDTNQIVSGTFKPSNYDTLDVFNAPAPGGPYPTNLAVFNGTSPDGLWSLYIADDNQLDSGNIAGGWSITLTTMSPVDQVVDLTTTMSDSPDPVNVGGTLVYTVKILNSGPAAATGVSVTNYLPAGVVFLSSTTSQGTFSTNSGLAIWTVGNLAVGARATNTVTVLTKTEGTLTDVAVAGSGQTELNALDNSASVKTSVLAVPAVGGVRQGNTLVFSWPTTANGYVLEFTGSLTPPIRWNAVTNVPVLSGSQYSVTNNIVTTNRFYRLKSP